MRGIELNKDLMEKRSYFIGDRVAASQILLLFTTGAICYLIEFTNLVSFFINYLWWVFLLVLPILMIIYMVVKRNSLYFYYHWQASFLLFFGIWSSYTIWLGLLVDSTFGYGNAFWGGVFIAAIYSTGYLIARRLRKVRHSMDTKTLAGFIALFSLLVIFVSISLGIYVYNIGWHSLGLLAGDYHTIISNPACRTGIYIIITGIGIVISMLLHYYTLYALVDPLGLDVEEDPPNELYIKIMIGSMILTFISWLLLIILFPPIAGGGKRKKKGKLSIPRGRRRRYYSRYGSYRYYGKKRFRKAYSKRVVEDEWKQYDLEER